MSSLLTSPLLGATLAALAAFAPVAPDARAEIAPALLDFREVVRDAKDKVFPAVLYVKCRREALERGRQATAEVAGSGVIISPDGLALSNWHVVEKALEVRCLLSDGRAMDATILGTDKSTDLALLQLHLPEDGAALPYAELGDSRLLTEGDFVMAMGAPWGLNRSVSLGVVSCVDRYLPAASEYSLWLQTDASISPGNSGGPLVNTDGEVIGINTRGAIIGGDLGFAVPSETILELLPHFRQRGEVEWAWTGLQLQPLRDFERNTYFDAEEGVVVAGTDPDSPARRAGVLTGDRIVALNGTRITALTAEGLPGIRRKFGLLPPGELLQIELLRGEQPMEISFAPRVKGTVEGDQLALPRWDMTVRTINQFANPGLYFHRQDGIFLYGIRRPGNAQNAGFSSRDILLEIEGQPVQTLEDVQRIHQNAIEQIDERHRLRFTVLRNGLRREIVLDFSRDFER